MSGYAYYSGTRFAVYGAGCSQALVRGGRYDEVGAVFGRRRPAVGFSLDLKVLAELALPTPRAGAVLAAQRLRAAGYPAPVVSVGSTPTALAATSLHGVTEVRAGVYAFFDLVMAGVGVCTADDVALSVLCTVIGAYQTVQQLRGQPGALA